MASGSTTLKKITTRAKHIRKTHGGSWKAAVKKAGAEYRAGKIHGVKKRKSVKKTARKKIVRRVKLLHAAEGKAIRRLRGVRSTFQAAAVGSVENATAAALRAALVRKTKVELGHTLMLRELAKTKTAKRLISKRISTLKRYIKKFE